MPVFELLLDYCSGQVRHEALHTKYASKKFLKGKWNFLLFQWMLNISIASLLVQQWSQRYVYRIRRSAQMEGDASR